MILVFLFLVFLILISLITLLILLSKIKIDINRVHIEANSELKFRVSFILKLRLCLFDKLTYFNMTIDNKKLNFKNFKEDKDINKEILFILRKKEYTVDSFKLHGKIGTENAAFTALSIGFLNIIIPILVLRKIDSNNTNNYYLNINPIFNNQNLVNLDFNCIISIKVVHIIDIIYFLIKKGRVNKNERTSHRRSYAYSHE